MQYYEPGFKIFAAKNPGSIFCRVQNLIRHWNWELYCSARALEVACLLQLEDIGNIFIRVRKSIYE